MPSQSPPGRRRVLLSLLSLATLAACGGGASMQAPTPTDPELDAAAQAAVAAGLVGVALGTVDDGRAGRRIGMAGRRRIDGAQAIAPDDLFNIGSNTKAMTAMVMASHVARGTLAWDVRIAEALPDVGAAMRPEYAGVTLQQLLDHRGGVLAFTGDAQEIEDFADALEADTSAQPTTLTGRRRYFARYLMQQQPPQGIVPGLDFSYSNAGYAVAAAVLEAITGQDFEALFTQVVVDGLGIEGQWRMPSDVPATLPPPQPVPHEGAQGALVVSLAGDLPAPSLTDWMRVLYPAGFWACGMPAYMRWLELHLQAMRGLSTPLPANYVAQLRALPAGRYALGWQGLVMRGHAMLAHDGQLGGFTTLASFGQHGHRAGMVVTNTSHMADDGSSWVEDVLVRTLTQVLSIDRA